MCWCTPEIRTPFCGAADCHPPGMPHDLGEFQTAPQADGCKHHRLDVSKSIESLEDTGRWILKLKIRCADCRTPFLFQGLPKGLDLEGAATDLTGTVARLALLPEGEPARPNSGPTKFGLQPPKGP